MAIGRDGRRHLIGAALLSSIAAVVFICIINFESADSGARNELLDGVIGGVNTGDAQTLNIASLEQEASSALPLVSDVSLAQPARMQSLADAGSSVMQMQEQQQQPVQYQDPVSESALSSVSGTLEGTNDIVSLKPINSPAAAATQMLSSPTSLSSVPWGATSEAAVEGPGYIQPTAEPLPIADCTGMGCVQRVPGTPASPGQLATPGHVYTEMDASLPQLVAQQTVRHRVPEIVRDDTRLEKQAHP